MKIYTKRGDSGTTSLFGGGDYSHLLRYESKFTEIPDPVSGAFYIEKLTKTLVEQTWGSLISAMEKAAGGSTELSDL